MILQKNRAVIAVFIFVSLFFGQFINRARASGITIAPASLDVSLKNDTDVEEQFISVKNNYTTKLKFAVEISTADPVTGKPLENISGNSELSGVIIADRTEFELEASKSTNLKLVFKDNVKLSPGGHYISVAIRPIDDAGVSVGLKTLISANVYLIKEQGAIRNVMASNLKLPKILFSLPRSLNLDFSNDGNVQLAPTAAVYISSSKTNFTNPYSKGVINESSRTVFPGKKITLNSQLNPIKRILWPGRVYAVAIYRIPGGAPSKLSQSALYIPLWFILAILLFLGLIYKIRKKFKKLKFNRA